MTSKNSDFVLSCPIPISDYPTILLAHGGGGKLMHQLIEKMFVTAFKNPFLEPRHDGAILNLSRMSDSSSRMAFTTDSYVVKPLFFPGGNIATLAINGTVNDLAMCGARPMYLSAGFILEEGLPMETLWRVVQSMKEAADEAGVQVVTGDTKVVDQGKGDGIFINTAGVGVIEHNLTISPSCIKPGDVVFLNGDVGRHGMAIMAVREGLEFESTIESDCAPLHDLVRALLDAGTEIHCMRDLTRGGLASALVEIAEVSHLNIHITESAVPVREDVQGACEILGFDPLYIANEGRCVIFVAAGDADRALKILRAQPLGKDACLIGEVRTNRQGASHEPGLVTLKSKIGATRIIDMLSGEQLPRIC